MKNKLIALFLSLLIPSFGFPESASAANRTNQRADAAVIAAVVMCYSIERQIKTNPSYSLLKESLHKKGLSHTLKYLKSTDGSRAIKIAFSYLEKDCKTFTEDEKVVVRALFPYL